MHHSVDTYYPSPTCIKPITRTLDVFEANFWGPSHSVAAIVFDEGAFERLVIYRTDLRDVFDDIDRMPLEILEEIVLPYEARDPIALAIGEASSLPTVSGHPSSYEQGISILYDDGTIRVFAPEDSTDYHTYREWPAHFVHDSSTNVVPAPPLPPGVTEREYCDVAFTQGGDIIVTFAQGPRVESPLKAGDFVLREGYVRYDRTASSWESPVTTILGHEFYQRTPSFDRSSCMSVDASTERPEILLAANGVDGWFSGARQVWGMDYESVGAFTTTWLGTIPTTGGYGNIQGVSWLDDDHFAAQHDLTASGDVFRIFEIDTLAQHDAVGAHAGVPGVELSGLAMTPVEGSGSCDNMVGLSSWESDGAGCSAIAMVSYTDCP